MSDADQQQVTIDLINAYEVSLAAEHRINQASAERELKLMNQLRRAEEVIQFYADQKNWKVKDEGDLLNQLSICARDGQSFGWLRDLGAPSVLHLIGGKFAREYFEKKEEDT
jgi:hypothetical protein